MAITEDGEKPVDSEEAALSIAACEGDGASFRTLYERWKPGLTAYVRGQIRTSEPEVQEIVADCMVEVCMKMRELEQPAKLKGFTFGVAKNLALRATRKAGRRGQEALDPEGEKISPEESAADEPDPEVCANDHEFDARYGAAMRTLPTVEAEVFVLRARYGRSDEEIARMFKWDPAEGKRTLKRARDKVRLMLRMEE